jgi:quercetin dioxygenase-like cupin family protein
MGPRWLLTILLLILVASASWAQSDNGMTFAAASQSKFVNLPNLPTCMKVAVQRGDPSKGPSVLLLKLQAGCTVPWHWHSAGESLMLVSGTGKAEMKDGQPATMQKGDYAYLPGKMIHQFTATSPVLMFDMPDGAFDIHYVDSAGNEIPLGDAVKKGIVIKPAAAPKTTVSQ